MLAGASPPPAVVEADPALDVPEPALLEPQLAVRRNQKTRWEGEGVAQRHARAQHGGLRRDHDHDRDRGRGGETLPAGDGRGEVHGGGDADTYASPALRGTVATAEEDGNDYSRGRDLGRVQNSAHQ